jgi:hypothetical protein
MQQLVCGEGGGVGLFRGGAENQTGTVVQKHEIIKCRHTHGEQNNRNAHIHTKLAGKNGSSNRGGLRSLRRRNGNTTHFIHLHEIHQATANMRLPR